jgi:hypothetical protein
MKAQDASAWVKHLLLDTHKKAVKKRLNHQKGLQMFQAARHKDLKETGDRGRTIPAKDIAVRYDVERAALKGGLSDMQVQTMRSAIERVATGAKLGHTADMAALIPAILEHELEDLKRTLGDSLTMFADAAAVVMDATTLAKEEKTCILVRVMSRDLYLQQRLVDITATSHHVSGLQDARLASRALARIGLTVESLVAFAADRHAGNGVCHEELSLVNDAILLIGCFSHTLDKVGKNFDCPELKKFMENLRSLLGLSNVAKQLFRKEDSEGKDLAGYAAIRWWNDWTQQVQILNMKSLDPIERVAKELADNKLCEASSKKILAALANPTTKAKIWIQMTASVEAGRPFCSAGFNMEGDAAGLPFLVAGQIKKLQRTFVLFPMPELRKAADEAAAIVKDLAAPAISNRAELAEEAARLRAALANATARQKKNQPAAKEKKRKRGAPSKKSADLAAAATLAAATALAKANTDVERLAGLLDIAEEQAEAARLSVEATSLVTPQQWYDFGVAAVAPGLQYFRDRFMDLDRVATGRGQKAINSGLLATKAFLAAEMFHPTRLAELASEDNGQLKIVAKLTELGNFPFVTPEDIAALLREAPDVIPHAVRNPKLPSVHVQDHVTMQKGSAAKKTIALARIQRRRFASAAKTPSAEDDALEEDEVSFPEAPDPLPHSLQGLREDGPKFNEEAHAVMEWWRRSTSASSAGMARSEAFPAWGKVLRKISLCCPSSAAAERVFSLLKLVLGDLEFSKHGSKVLAAMLMKCNDIDV